jgi:hypothetical protein
MAKMIQHVRDYIKAVMQYGPKFYKIETQCVDMDHLFDGIKSLPGGKNDHKERERIATLVYGKKAYEYFLQEDENEIGFAPTCEYLGCNLYTIRKKLLGMTKEQAAVYYRLFLRGEAKVKYDRRKK